MLFLGSNAIIISKERTNNIDIRGLRSTTAYVATEHLYSPVVLYKLLENLKQSIIRICFSCCPSIWFFTLLCESKIWPTHCFLHHMFRQRECVEREWLLALYLDSAVIERERKSVWNSRFASTYDVCVRTYPRIPPTPVCRQPQPVNDNMEIRERNCTVVAPNIFSLLNINKRL